MTLDVGSPLPKQVVHASAAYPVKLLPPIPAGPRFSEEEHLLLLEGITQELSTLLRLPFAIFWSAVLHPQYPAYSVSCFLDAYFRLRPNDPALAQKVFYLICRLTLAPEEAEAEERREDELGSADVSDDAKEALEWSIDLWPDIVYTSGLITLPRLLEVAREFGNANTPVLRHAFQTVLHVQQKLLKDLNVAVDMIVGSVHIFQKKYGKLSKNAGKGKGKGKGKFEEEAPHYRTGANTSSDDPRVDAGTVNGDAMPIQSPSASIEQTYDADFLYDAILDLRAFVLTGGSTVARVVLSNKDFVPALTDIYQVANIFTGADNHNSDITDDGKASGNWDSTAIMDVEGALSDNDVAIASRARRLKGAVVVLLEAIIQVEFLEPMKLVPTEPVDLNQISLADVHKRAESLCDLVMQLLELSPFDGPVTFLCSAPLLVDLEVDFGICDRLKQIRERYMKDESDARLDYLVVSLEHLLTFSANAEVKRVIANRKRKRVQQRKGEDKVDEAVIDGANDANLDSEAINEDFIKRTLLISQIQDLFSDLGEGFIEACLIAFNDDVEMVIMKILENDLPDYVTKLDRQMPRTAPITEPVSSEAVSSANASTEESIPNEEVPEEPSLLATRRNAFDGDEFDVFSRGHVDSEKVIFGKKERTNGVLNDKSFVQEQREAILAAQYDDYDDEYDDTYDASEIKLAGTIELHLVDEEEGVVEDGRPRQAVPVDEPSDPFAKHEAELVAIYQSDRQLFDKSQRKSPKRLELRKRTGYSDEQLEGWFTMFERNPRKNRILEKYAWRGNRAGDVEEARGAPDQIRSPQHGNGSSNNIDREERAGQGGTSTGNRGSAGDSVQGKRGAGVGRDGTGFPHGAPLERQRARKEKNKGRGANHSRKDGHARKLGRGMGGPL
ncbi:uncharacterized protein SPPG_04079 [Spizellomyces punctatus DAOM BR117]|uniref:CUE domain-containing protein n=1 Tax=Spizellomyces punctatus (strain DAOM BR117) TaxID=645134 RepID=A0A0L0HHN1_SPIPD|nr:uncharacterized protein SPPG_04079 [Spizellomyces punctatus DAOM BR117]KND00981.1 hypothetical protein SPPG_04079 [Spizellomyces punctatus DAOM BR117]|eukprot:XP_016609020.1 hypothetical protein SPPG_04079 [Spizellomyces punctatus DAOM BR117]